MGLSCPRGPSRANNSHRTGYEVVNVTRMETVRFAIDQGGIQKSFTWRFDTLPFRPFTLNDIAPTGVPALQNVKVHVARNPYLDGGGGRRSSGSAR